MPALGAFAFFDKIYAQYCYYCDFIAWIWRTSDYLYITITASNAIIYAFSFIVISQIIDADLKLNLIGIALLTAYLTYLIVRVIFK